MSLRFFSPISAFTSELQNQALQALRQLDERTGKGNDFLGWIDWPTKLVSSDEIDRIRASAQRLMQQSDVVVVAGIGGSYLGAKAVIDTCTNPFAPKKVIYAGYHFDEVYHTQLLKYLDTVNYSCIIISKSGTTLETKNAFDKLCMHATKKYGEQNIKNRFVTVTDPAKGLLRDRTTNIGCESYPIPSDIGGRYSVFTACGLLPAACAGVDIAEFARGANDAVIPCKSTNTEENIALHYAMTRFALHTKENKLTEILVPFVPNLGSIGGRWQQLYGESEGKDGKGILPITLSYSTDLHSMGQYVQDGPRNFFETFLRVDAIEKEQTGADNKACFQGTREAHTQGKIPVLQFHIDSLSPHTLGYFLYTCMKACGISGYMIGVNPFDQPGVEAYKAAMRKYL